MHPSANRSGGLKDGGLKNVGAGGVGVGAGAAASPRSDNKYERLRDEMRMRQEEVGDVVESEAAAAADGGAGGGEGDSAIFKSQIAINTY